MSEDSPYNIHDINSALIFLAAGAFATLVTQLLLFIGRGLQKCITKKSQFRNLCLELHYNLKTIQEAIDNLNVLERHILGNDIAAYITNFNFHKVIYITLDALTKNGLLYKELTLKELQGLQTFLGIFNAGTNLDFRNKVEFYRNNYLADPATHPLMIRMIPFWRDQLVESKNAVETVFNKLASKYKYTIRE